MSGIDEEYNDIVQAEGGGEMQGGIAVIGEIGVLEELRVRMDNAFEQGKVGKVNSPAKASGWVDHGGWRLNLGSRVGMRDT